MDDILDVIAAYEGAAIVTPQTTVTYPELAARVDRLARVLRGAGIRTDRVCAIALERGPEAVAAMVAVLVAGGAFLTVDTDLPAARIAALTRACDVLLTDAAGADRLAGAWSGPTVLVDDACAAMAALPAAYRPRSLAYVSHTSGSTGEPNGVMIERRGLQAYLRFVVRDFALGAHTVALQLAPFGYDASIRDTLAPLLAGGRLVLLPRATLLRPDEFFTALVGYQVNTILSATPSFLTFLGGQPRAAERLSGLDLVVVSGESLRPFLASGGRRLLGGRLVNQYGPTECTMTSTRLHVPVPADAAADLVGTPIDGMTARLLDEQMRDVAGGEVGEVYLGGAGVARGYAGRPALTADRFVPDPAGPPGARLYRTGDLARRGSDGGLEYLGRRDRQIKIRGYRVDPGEIEAALLTHPAVTGAAVTTDVDAQQRLYMVAHVTGDLTEVRDAALRKHLAITLPPHLMPRRITRLDRFPRTRSGKVDRTALAAGDVR